MTRTGIQSSLGADQAVGTRPFKRGETPAASFDCSQRNYDVWAIVSGRSAETWSRIGASFYIVPDFCSEPVSVPTSVANAPCASLTPPQIEKLKQMSEATEAIKQAENFAGYQQTDYQPGDSIPVNVVIATNLYTTNFDSAEVAPISNAAGYGLFLTMRELVANYPGTYWCINTTGGE